MQGRVVVKVMRGGLNPALRRLRVTEEEIARIAAAQMEQPEQVAAFFLSEGSLSGSREFRRLWLREDGSLRP